MIIHAKVAKLYSHIGDYHFDRIISHINAAQDEGLTHYDLDASNLSPDILTDLIEALCTMEYDVDYDTDAQMLYVSL